MGKKRDDKFEYYEKWKAKKRDEKFELYYYAKWKANGRGKVKLPIIMVCLGISDRGTVVRGSALCSELDVLQAEMKVMNKVPVSKFDNEMLKELLWDRGSQIARGRALKAANLKKTTRPVRRWTSCKKIMSIEAEDCFTHKGDKLWKSGYDVDMSLEEKKLFLGTGEV